VVGAEAVANGTATALRRKIGLVLPRLLESSNGLLANPRIGELYPEYLFTSHCVIRASVPLMETAKTRAEELAPADPMAAALAQYFEEHIPEELDHDEWLLQDLEVLGLERAGVLARPPSPTVAALVGAQYYWILHYHPVALLGYIAVFEGYPPSPDMIDRLVASTGYSRDAFRTMIGHAELDPGHRDELDRLLDGLNLTREQSTVVGLSGMYSADAFARAIDEIVEEAP
jgi:pyrroloquinoline quinone (PQQ) biosynthesis protein C